MLSVKVDGLAQSDSSLRKFADSVEDLRPFWRELGQGLAETIDARWPLRRRTGRLRESLMWAGDRLGRGGIFESDPDRLRFGTSVFYGRFFQHGAKHTPRRPIIHIDESQHSRQLSSWLQARAAAGGLEVKT